MSSPNNPAKPQPIEPIQFQKEQQMQTEELQTLEIPLSKLLAWNDNVRATGAEEGIGELADSIAAVGLLQGLVVKKEPRGKYAVIAGRRRLMALSKLADGGKLKATMPIPCRIAPKDADLLEISLTENFCRSPIHPADEFKAFQLLIESGKSVADVAARFGVTDAVVLRRLALARVGPNLIDRYREGELNLELLQAFTLTDNHDAQEAVWNQLQPWNRKPHIVRQLLSNDDIPASDKRVRFVGLENYELAGGGVRRDLFADGEAGTYISDPAILNRLVSEKLKTLSDEIGDEGWKWIEIQPEIDHQAISRYRRVYAPELLISEEAQAEITALEETRERLAEKLADEEEAEESSENQAIYDQIDEIDARIQAIRRHRKVNYSDDIRARCGVVIGLGQDGEATFVRGLLRKEDEKEVSGSDDANERIGSAPANPAPEPESANYSAALVETLTQHKTAAIAVELSQRPSIALAAVVHAMTLSEFGLDLNLYRSKTCVQVSTREAFLEGASGSPALASLQRQKGAWLEILAAQPDIWAWCLKQDQPTLLKLLAHLVARTVNAVKSKSDTEDDTARFAQADHLVAALDVDMSKWFTPTAENFFSKISKASIAEALAEAGKPASADSLKLKKAQLAALGETELKSTRWLPVPIRTSSAAATENHADAPNGEE
jgi:ParB family chromosome partitioning protein